MLRAYKYRLYPNREQQVLLAKTFGCTRFIYNRMLADKIEHYKNTGSTLKNTPAQYKTEFPWLKEVDSLALANAQLNLDKAYKNFFRDPKIGFPNFKKRTNWFSYSTNNQKNSVRLENGKVKLPKIGFVSLKQHRLFDGTIKTCTVSKVPSGKYFISILVEEKIDLTLPASDKKVGIDLGLKSFAVLSDQNVIDNPKFFTKYQKRLAFLQKSLARKKKGSKNRDKARVKVAKLHEKIANCRADFAHKLSKTIIDENQVVVVEDLKTKNLMKNHKLAKSIADASWRQIRTFLTYKSVWYGRKLVVAPSNYASSQLCSGCGNKSPQTKDLGVRTYICDKCGLVIDRDYNATLNLVKLA